MNKTGFGFLRLPRLDPADEKSVDFDALNAMVDRFLELGGDYFDTAYTYLGGASEAALKRALVERHPRSRYRIADKLPGWKLKTREACEKAFEEQLKRCGVDYFDAYLIHWLNAANYAVCESCDQFGFLRELKASGRVGRIGFSYHDGPELLDRILTEHPEAEIVQLQLNYLDWDSGSLQARQCYEVAVKHGRHVVVMEPVKGGSLAQLPGDAGDGLAAARPGDTNARWAIRFATDLENVEIVLSGMSDMAQLEDNMGDMEPLSGNECELLAGVAEKLRAAIAVPCTGCGYCTAGCPVQIPIPDYFALYNEYARNPGDGWKMQHVYDGLAARSAKASQCVECGACEKSCPQQLPIIGTLKKVAKAFG